MKGLFAATNLVQNGFDIEMRFVDDGVTHNLKVVILNRCQEKCAKSVVILREGDVILPQSLDTSAVVRDKL